MAFNFGSNQPIGSSDTPPLSLSSYTYAAFNAEFLKSHKEELDALRNDVLEGFKLFFKEVVECKYGWGGRTGFYVVVDNYHQYTVELVCIEIVSKQKWRVRTIYGDVATREGYPMLEISIPFHHTLNTACEDIPKNHHIIIGLSEKHPNNKRKDQ